MALIAVNGSLSISYIKLLFTQPATPITEFVEYLESISAPDELIESYESELFYILDRPCHYPLTLLNSNLSAAIFCSKKYPLHMTPWKQVLISL
jgi:hypothetical protein